MENIAYVQILFNVITIANSFPSVPQEVTTPCAFGQQLLTKIPAGLDSSCKHFSLLPAYFRFPEVCTLRSVCQTSLCELEVKRSWPSWVICAHGMEYVRLTKQRGQVHSRSIDHRAEVGAMSF